MNIMSYKILLTLTMKIVNECYMYIETQQLKFFFIFFKKSCFNNKTQ